MKLQKFAMEFAVTFAAATVAGIVVSLLYSLVVHGAGVIDWEASIRLGLILGLVLPWVRRREKKGK